MKRLLRYVFLLLLLPLCANAPSPTQAEPQTNVSHVPIIMYHLVTNNPKYIGKYGVRPAELEQDLQYLQQHGYTTVVMQDLIDFVQQGTPLPPKPVVLTFDDGNTSDLQHLLPLLRQYNMKAVLSVMGHPADKYTPEQEKYPTAAYPNLTWPQIAELHASGLCEIQSHGYNVHGPTGAGKKKSESADAYQARLLADLTRLNQGLATHLDGYVPTTFTYPLGIVSDGSQAVLQQIGFVASLGCEEGMNKLTPHQPDALWRMHRINRPSGRGIGALLDKLGKM